MFIEDRVVKDIKDLEIIMPGEIFYSETTKQYYTVCYVGSDSYNLYSLNDGCLTLKENVYLEELKEILATSNYRLVKHSRMIIEGEIN